jgi:hypothetical protein
MILSLGFVFSSRADPPAQNQAAPPAKNAAPTQPTAPAIPAQALLKSDAWNNVPATPLEPGEIDRLLDKEFQINKIVSSPLTTDEQFLRRIRLDLTGQLPTVAEIDAFLADPDPAKRTKCIDQLLASDDYARHWARYWRETVMAVEAPFGDAHAPAFEDWLYDQFKQNRPWGDK